MTTNTISFTKKGGVRLRKTAFVTGGSGGIGRSICRMLIESDYDVYFTYLSNKKSAVEVEKLGTNGQIVKGIQCDISQFENVVDCFSIIKNNTSKLDVLVNNAGASYDELLINMSNSIWDNSIALNLNGAFYCLNNALPMLLENGGGNIINISSIMGSIGWTGLAHYSAAKAGLEALTRTASVELGRFNIRVNSISPGMLKTEMSKEAIDKKENQIKKLTPLKKYGEVEDVAKLVMFLISDDAKFITGENYFVRGGLGAALSVK